MRIGTHEEITGKENSPAMFRIRICLALATAIGLLSGPPAAAADLSVPALKVTAPNGATSILIGSLHIAAKGLIQPAPTVMADVERYVVEGVGEPFVKDPNATVDHERIDAEVLNGRASRAGWARALTEDQQKLLLEQVRCNTPLSDAGLVTKGLLMLESAAHASNIAILRCGPPGLLSRDELLRRAAAAKGLVPTPLESSAAVQRQRNEIPEHIYRYQLYRSFTPESTEGLRRAVRALNSGDYAKIIQVLADLSASPADAKTYYRIMVAERNRAWMPKLMEYLDAGGAFVNVGASHLPGPEGLVAMLQAKGYRLVPYRLPSDNVQ